MPTISRRKFFTTTASLLALGAVGTGTYLTIDSYQDYENITKNAPKDLDGNAVQYEDPISEQEITDMNVQESVEIDVKSNDDSNNDSNDDTTKNNDGKEASAKKEKLTLKIPAVNMLVNVGELSVVNNVINPPGFKNAYLTRNLGANIQQPADGTVYMTMHSLRNGFGPGNYIIDVKNKRSKLSAGDDIYIGELHYKVSKTEVIDKDKLPDEKDIWVNSPNRLVIITCLQKESGKSEQNSVVFANIV